MINPTWRLPPTVFSESHPESGRPRDPNAISRSVDAVDRWTVFLGDAFWRSGWRLAPVVLRLGWEIGRHHVVRSRIRHRPGRSTETLVARQAAPGPAFRPGRTQLPIDDGFIDHQRGPRCAARRSFAIFSRAVSAPVVT